MNQLSAKFELAFSGFMLNAELEVPVQGFTVLFGPSGCGKTTLFVPLTLRDAIKERGIVLEPMDTGAACRTFNVLLGEDRRIAAALMLVD